MSHDHTQPDWDEYGTLIKELGVRHADERKAQVKIALDADDEDFGDLLRRVMKDHDGRRNPALRSINEQLDVADHHPDEYGAVSSSTFYDWCREHDVDVNR